MFKVGDRVRWIAPSQNGLTNGKVYEIVKTSEHCVYIDDDNGGKRIRSICEVEKVIEATPRAVFKPGDKVRWIAPSECGITQGNIYTLRYCQGDYVKFINDTGGVCIELPSKVEKVIEYVPPPPKSEEGYSARWIGENEPGITKGNIYYVTHPDGWGVDFKDDDGDVRYRDARLFERVEYPTHTLVSVNTTSPAPRVLPKVGDMVRSLICDVGVEMDKEYLVTYVCDDGEVSICGTIDGRQSRLFRGEYEYPVAPPPNTLTLKAKVIYYPQTGRYTIYGTNEAEAMDLVIADLAHDIEGHGPYVMFEVNAALPIPETKVYNVTATPLEGDNYD